MELPLYDSQEAATGFILECYMQFQVPVSKTPEQTGTNPGGGVHLEKDFPLDMQDEKYLLSSHDVLSALHVASFHLQHNPTQRVC